MVGVKFGKFREEILQGVHVVDRRSIVRACVISSGVSCIGVRKANSHRGLDVNSGSLLTPGVVKGLNKKENSYKNQKPIEILKLKYFEVGGGIAWV
jgi:hypothetical protein